MFSRQYLDELDMQIERTRRAYKWSQAIVLGMAVLLGCATAYRKAHNAKPAQHIECRR